MMGLSSFPPSLWRRMMGMVYEACLIYFAVSFAATYLLLALLQWQWPLGETRSLVLSCFLFLVYGFYFTYFWSRGGQTLAMKTVEVTLVQVSGAALTQWQAWRRYFLCWWGLFPGMLVMIVAPERKMLAFLVFFIAQLLSILWALFDCDGQFLHDRWAGTRLVVIKSAS